MNFYTAIETAVKRAIVYAPFTAARAIDTAYSRLNPPYSHLLTLSRLVFFWCCSWFRPLSAGSQSLPHRLM